MHPETISNKKKALIAIGSILLVALTAGSVVIALGQWYRPPGATSDGGTTSAPASDTSPPDRPAATEDTLLRQAREAMDQDDVDAAIAKLEEANMLKGNNPDVMLELGKAYRRAGRTEDAIAQLERAAAIYASIGNADGQAEAEKLLGELGGQRNSEDATVINVDPSE